jgi:hypothetical protein
MSNQDKLNLYIRQLHQRLRLGVSLRGVAILMATALITTIFLVLILNAFAFPVRGLTGARSLLLLILALAAAFGLALPMRRLTRGRATAVAESAYPEFQQRLLTFDDREKRGNDPFLELLAADTLAVAKDVPPANLAPNNRLYFLAGAGFACLAVLAWLIAAGPGYLGYGASLLWTGPKAGPLYDIRVTPGDVAVRRNSDQLVTAQVIGLKPGKVQLFAHYQSARNKAWEPVAMQPQLDASGGPGSPDFVAPSFGASNFQFLFAGLPEDVEYYVQAGPLTSRHFKVRVVDLPSVKQVRVTYHYPKWTGMPQVTEEHGGDLRAIEGTNAELTLQMDRPLRNGQLTLDDGKQITLSGGEGNLYKGSILMQKDGAYHVAAVDQGQPVRLSEDYFIATDKANPPQIAIDRPTGDYRASPIEEVTVGVKASDDFGLNKMSLHYSVNGGPEKTVDLLQKPGAKNADGTATLSLEDFKLVPGDLVSLYATAKDGHAEARTDMSFIQADPFEREFSQSQQMGGGGGGGGAAGSQTDISKREKELIAATWKRQNEKTSTPKDSAEAGNFLSGVQTKLQEQALSLAARMDSRDLSAANEEFNSFGHDMQAAAAAMTPSSEKLKQMQWHDAIPAEQKALQYLLRAEATFRKIEVAFGQRGGGGGGGGGGAGRDLASLFDLELDTEKNQYETAQTGSAADQRAKAVDDALQRLDALARRQEELAQQQRNNPQTTMQERWQQEMLRREAEQLQKQMEQLAQNSQPKNDQQGQQGGQQQQGQQGQQGQASQQGQQGQQSSGGSSTGSSSGGQSSQSRAGGSRAQSNADGGAGDPRVTQALNRLRDADEQMKRSAGQQQSADAARQAADQLRQAESLMSSTQQQQATGKLDSLSREADRLSKEEHAQADRVRGLAGRPDASSQADYTARLQQRTKLAEDRQQLSDDLSQLEKNMRNSARELAPTQPQASSKLRDALSGMDQTDLTNRVQRTADWLRRGINPNANGTEEGISKGLDQLSQQVHQAQQGLGPGKPGQGQSQDGQQTAALDHVERFRNQIESLTARGQNPLGRQPGQQQGQQGGQPGQQPGQGGQPGQSGQSGQRQGSSSNQGGPGAQIAQNGSGNQRGGNQVAQDNLSGDVGNWRSGGGAVGTAWNNINTGNNHFDRSGRPAAPDNSPVPADPEATYRQGLEELSQLHHLAQNDPTALKEVQDLVREMQRLDPKRFPGNPAMVEQLHTEVLSGLDKLELQLRHDSSDEAGQVRTTKEPPVQPGYEEAVAEYFRRLGKGQ